MLVQLAMQAASGTLLIRDWVEARALWDRLVAIEGLRALVLMPTHDHVIVPPHQAFRVKEASRSFAMWRNHHRGEYGKVWRHGARPVPIEGDDHLTRAIRYFMLNPCRAQLVADPLAWPFSTHRDMLGLAWPAARRPVSDPDGFHGYVSADKAVDPHGTPLPVSPEPWRIERASLQEVRAAISSLTRTPTSLLTRRGSIRTLLLRAARVLTGLPVRHIAEAYGVHASTVSRAASPRRDDPRVALVARVLTDPRFGPLTDDDLPWLNPHFRRRRSGCGRC